MKLFRLALLPKFVQVLRLASVFDLKEPSFWKLKTDSIGSCLSSMPSHLALTSRMACPYLGLGYLTVTPYLDPWQIEIKKPRHPGTGYAGTSTGSTETPGS